MKYLLMILSVIIFTACDVDNHDDAIVISADGLTEIGYCNSINALPVCVQKLCPNGSFTLKGAERTPGPSVVRCKD